MNTIGEIGEQNKQDFLSLMYLYVGQSLMKTCGRQAERAIRHAVYETGKREGEELRRKYGENGIKANLNTLYQGAYVCTCDPRQRIQVMAATEQMRIWEVYTCPLANLWLDQGGAYLGNCYCEEQQYGLVKGLTEEIGQLNLTKKLTCHRTNGCRPDNYCRFSAYYRAANVDPKKRDASFHSQGEEEETREISLPHISEELKKQFIRLYCALYEASKEQFGDEGVCAIAEGLKRLQAEMKTRLLYHGEATLRRCDAGFLDENLPFSLNPSNDRRWEECGDPECKKLFEGCVLRPLKKYFLESES